jgi:hypothetical protein
VISVFSNKISKYIEKKKYKLCLLIINHLDSVVVKINLFHVNNFFFFNLAEILIVERSGGLLFLHLL